MNNATGNVAKQLAQASRNMMTLNSRFTQFAGSKIRKQARKAKRGIPNRSSYGITATQIPMEIAYSVRQPITNRIHTETACEYIGDFVIRTSAVNGEGVRFPMNPLLMFRTRLFNIARNYQKFRFTKLALKVQSSATTSSSGLYVAAYCANPDYEYQQTQAVASLFSLPGAQSTNIWRTIVVEANLQDKGKWYNIDDDSFEIMSTTQGFFGLAVQSPPDTSKPVVMPVLLEYTVQFSGNAYNNVNSGNSIFIFPAGNWTKSSGGIWSFTAFAGEPAVPTLTAGAYIVNPTYPVTTTVGLQDKIMVIRNGVPDTYDFFNSLETMAQNDRLQLASFTSERTTWTLVV